MPLTSEMASSAKVNPTNEMMLARPHGFVLVWVEVLGRIDVQRQGLKFPFKQSLAKVFASSSC